LQHSSAGYSLALRVQGSSKGAVQLSRVQHRSGGCSIGKLDAA
jgi:hypothetical protein